MKTDQSDDVVKALRKSGVTAKVFKYDKAAWDAEKRELVTLQEQFGNQTIKLNQLATNVFQETMSALMHLKVIRAYIEGVLRFSLEKSFMIGLLCPKKGQEKSILQEMTSKLSEQGMEEYYGEKMDAAEADDYWPFVALPLTAPLHVFEERQQ